MMFGNNMGSQDASKMDASASTNKSFHINQAPMSNPNSQSSFNSAVPKPFLNQNTNNQQKRNLSKPVMSTPIQQKRNNPNKPKINQSPSPFIPPNQSQSKQQKQQNKWKLKDFDIGKSLGRGMQNT